MRLASEEWDLIQQMLEERCPIQEIAKALKTTARRIRRKIDHERDRPPRTSPYVHHVPTPPSVPLATRLQQAALLRAYKQQDPLCALLGDPPTGFSAREGTRYDHIHSSVRIPYLSSRPER